jgi:hypothetical protein
MRRMSANYPRSISVHVRFNVARDVLVGPSAATATASGKRPDPKDFSGRGDFNESAGQARPITAVRVGSRGGSRDAAIAPLRCGELGQRWKRRTEAAA